MSLNSEKINQSKLFLLHFLKLIFPELLILFCFALLIKYKFKFFIKGRSLITSSFKESGVEEFVTGADPQNFSREGF